MRADAKIFREIGGDRMKPLSKHAAKALETLKAGGFFTYEPMSAGKPQFLHSADGIAVDGFGRKGFAKSALRELHNAGFEFFEDMGVRRTITRRLAVQAELLTS